MNSMHNATPSTFVHKQTSIWTHWSYLFNTTSNFFFEKHNNALNRFKRIIIQQIKNMYIHLSQPNTISLVQTPKYRLLTKIRLRNSKQKAQTLNSFPSK